MKNFFKSDNFCRSSAPLKKTQLLLGHPVRYLETQQYLNKGHEKSMTNHNEIAKRAQLLPLIDI